MSILRPAEGKHAAYGGKSDEGPDHCQICQSVRVWKNGVYFCDQLVGIFSACTGSASHAWRSNAIAVGHAVGRFASRNGSAWRKRAARLAILLKRLAAFSKFKLALSDRRTALLAAFAFWPGYLRYVCQPGDG